MKDKRTVLQEMLWANPHSPPSADAILNALHQAGWKVVPKDDLLYRDRLGYPSDQEHERG